MTGYSKQAINFIRVDRGDRTVHVLWADEAGGSPPIHFAGESAVMPPLLKQLAGHRAESISARDSDATTPLAIFQILGGKN
jgi:hypothetical protein